MQVRGGINQGISEQDFRGVKCNVSTRVIPFLCVAAYIDPQFRLAREGVLFCASSEKIGMTGNAYLIHQMSINYY